MTNRPAEREDDEGLAQFRDLGTYMSAATLGRMKRGRLFSLCVRASLAKCYEYNLLAWDKRRSVDAFSRCLPFAECAKTSLC